MDDGDEVDVLEVGRKEITLDRPPVTFKGGTDNHDPNLSLRYSCTVDGIVEKQVIPNGLDKISFSPSEFHPLSSSEKVDEQVSTETVDTDSDQNNVIEQTNSDLNYIEIVSTAEDQTPQVNSLINRNNGADGKYSKKHVFKRKHKREIVSCLKSNGSPNANAKKEAKSVQFLDGSDIISELIEPVDPWRDVRTPSKSEVVSFYRNSCQKLRSRPIDKVIKQIQDIQDLSCRAGTLVLRGCRLDSRACEALESVFRRIQFENLDLENCGLEEEGATSLLEMIEFYHSTCKLNIAFNPKIGMRGWQALCRMLRKTSCLTYLDARRTLLTDMTMPTFGRCLKADPPLKILHLENVYLSGRPLLILTTAMKYNRVLEELYIGDNDLTVNDGPPIGAMLTYNPTLQLLDLRNNHLKDIGLAHIGNGLCDQAEQDNGAGLSSLILWNNQITHEGMAYICEGLVRTGSLKALNLGQNRLGDLGLQKLKAGLIKNKSIRKLGFLNTKVGSEGAVALAEVLADSQCITRIDIRENHIQVAGLMAFSMALKVNHSLLRLDLDKDIKKEPGMESVMQAVLVDIYNLCHRNKLLLQEDNSLEVDGTQLARQSSVSSEASDMTTNEDFFHPETRRQEVVPFSPVVYDPTNSKEGFVFPISSSNASSSEPSESKGKVEHNQNEAQKEIAKHQTDLSKRANRFSVTKILDNLGHHAVGVANKIANNVANIDKLKRNNSKEKIEINSAELLPMSEQGATDNSTTVDKTSGQLDNIGVVENDDISPEHIDVDKSETNKLPDVIFDGGDSETSKENSDSNVNERFTEQVLQNSITTETVPETVPEHNFTIDISKSNPSFHLNKENTTAIVEKNLHTDDDEKQLTNDELDSQSNSVEEKEISTSLDFSNVSSNFQEGFSSENVFRRVDSLPSPTSMVIHGTVALDLTS